MKARHFFFECWNEEWKSEWWCLVLFFLDRERDLHFESGAPVEMGLRRENKTP